MVQNAVKIQPLFLTGYGGVGRALARQIIAARARHAQRCDLRLEIVGIADSRGARIEPAGFSDEALAALDAAKTATGALDRYDAPAPPALDPFVARDLIVVDSSASDAAVPVLRQAARQGRGGVVLANKLPLAGPLAWWDDVTGGRARWETTCGAALPVISTLNTLLNSNDDVLKIEGSLSGTLAFLSAQLEAGRPFGAAVREARDRGYTEPDPRQDLGGRDAARKALILARMLGYRLEMDDVVIEPLYPASMDGLSVEEFLRAADTLDAPMAARAAALTRGGRKLRYAARIENGACQVGLAGAEPDSKLGLIRAGDSVVVFTTKQFNANPVSISGPGAGQEVTASGVLGDIVSLK
jgi:homoserine dehydrogenase